MVLPSPGGVWAAYGQQRMVLTPTISRLSKRYETLALLVCYAAYIGSYLPTFRDNLSAPSSRVKQSRPTGRPETSVTTILGCVTSQKSEDLIYTAAEAWNYAKPMLFLSTSASYCGSLLSKPMPRQCITICGQSETRTSLGTTVVVAWAGWASESLLRTVHMWDDSGCSMSWLSFGILTAHSAHADLTLILLMRRIGWAHNNARK